MVLLVLVRLVAETDRRGLAAAAQLVGEDARVEVEDLHGRRELTCAGGRAPFRPSPARPCRRARSAPRSAASIAPSRPRSRGRRDRRSGTRTGRTPPAWRSADPSAGTSSG